MYIDSIALKKKKKEEEEQVTYVVKNCTITDKFYDGKYEF